MPLYAQATAFLAPDDDWLALHQRADEFETHRRLMHLDPEFLCHCIHQMAGRHRANNRTSPVTVLHQMVERQGENLVCIDERPVAINDGEAVGVRIESQADRKSTRLNSSHLG